MAQLIGIDVGYGFVKVTDGEAGYSFPSVVGEGHTKPTFSTRMGQFSAIDHLKSGHRQKDLFCGKSRHQTFQIRLPRPIL